MTAFSTQAWGETYAVRADWDNASDRVEALDSDGDWVDTGRQVADYRHAPEAALRAQLELSALASGPLDDDVFAEIDAAMDWAASEADVEDED